LQVGWDESTAGERQPRVSLWEIEPLTTFPMYPSPFPLRLKRPWPPGLPSFHGELVHVHFLKKYLAKWISKTFIYAWLETHSPCSPDFSCLNASRHEG